MTHGTELLPLPLTTGYEPDCAYPEWVNTLLTDYARANVTAALASAQAREEELRAEVDEWKRVAAAQAELNDEAEARAFRLEQALRSAEALAVCCMAIDGYSRMELLEMAEAMLPVYRAALTGETT